MPGETFAGCSACPPLQPRHCEEPRGVRLRVSSPSDTWSVMREVMLDRAAIARTPQGKRVVWHQILGSAVMGLLGPSSEVAAIVDSLAG